MMPLREPTLTGIIDMDTSVVNSKLICRSGLLPDVFLQVQAVVTGHAQPLLHMYTSTIPMIVG